jgi:hypothetical protein
VVPSALLRWLLTVDFGAVTAWFAFGLGLAGSRRGGVAPAGAGWLSDAAHALLGVAMIAMIWSRTAVVVSGWFPAAAFASAAAWFLGRAWTAARWSPYHARANLHHTVMAASMAWMAIAAPATPMPHHAGHSPPAVGVLLGGYFLIAVPLWIIAAIGIGGGGTVDRRNFDAARHAEAACHAAISLGMGVLLLTAA